jgi:hypothetical protein
MGLDWDVPLIGQRPTARADLQSSQEAVQDHQSSSGSQPGQGLSVALRRKAQAAILVAKSFCGLLAAATETVFHSW